MDTATLAGKEELLKRKRDRVGNLLAVRSMASMFPFPNAPLPHDVPAQTDARAVDSRQSDAKSFGLCAVKSKIFWPRWSCFLTFSNAPLP